MHALKNEVFGFIPAKNNVLTMTFSEAEGNCLVDFLESCEIMLHILKGKEVSEKEQKILDGIEVLTPYFLNKISMSVVKDNPLLIH